MPIKELSFINARNLTEKHLKLNPNTTIFIGNNGTGKTTILETISFISTAKSFRKKHNKSIITSISYYFENGDRVMVGCVDREDKTSDLRVILRAKNYGYFIDNKAYK